ncbi:MAG: Exodeoxyribonuclease 7 small subunit [Acidobacteria bacterium]|nr:Exodeoxyribonuclease 7 small subunit [Acidobacteriota bacterium]
MSFESSLASLEQVVAQLESGDLPLERALELFEEGVGLARRCQSQLQDAERKVEMLLRERGEIKVVPFEVLKDMQMNASETPQAHSANNATSGPKRIQSEEEHQEGPLDDAVPF